MLEIVNYALFDAEHKILEIPQMRIVSGKKIVVIGRNRSGKSLFLKSINGDYSGYDGEVLLKGKLNLLYRKKKKTLLISGRDRLIPDRDAWSNLILPFDKVSHRDEEKMLDFADQCGIKHKLETNTEYLSKSERKIIEIIRAAIIRPYLILLDDHDIFFDEIMMIKINSVLDYAVKAGTSIIATSKFNIPDFDYVYRIQNKKLELINQKAYV